MGGPPSRPKRIRSSADKLLLGRGEVTRWTAELRLVQRGSPFGGSPFSTEVALESLGVEHGGTMIQFSAFFHSGAPIQLIFRWGSEEKDGERD